MLKKKNGTYFDESKWEEVHEDNKYFMEEFLNNKRELSKQTLKQYESSLTIFFLYVSVYARNKPITELRRRDILSYQNWLLDEGLSSSAINLRRSAISSLCNYIDFFYEDEYPMFRNIVQGVEPPVPNTVHKKEPLSLDEMDTLREALKEDNRWQELAYLEISYSTGARRAEIQQLKKEIVGYEMNEGGFYTTHEVRTKGRGEQGNVRSLHFSEEARVAIKKWLDVRGEDDCEYIFISYEINKKTNKREARQVNATTFNYWCSDIFSEIINRRIHPHLLRTSRATALIEEGKDINTARNLLGHQSSETTELYVIRDEQESLNDAF